MFKYNEKNESTCYISSEATDYFVCKKKKLLHYVLSRSPFFLTSTRQVPTGYHKPRKELGTQECVISISSMNE